MNIRLALPALALPALVLPALVLAVPLALPAMASAAPLSGVYVSLQAGTSTLNPYTGTLVGPGQPAAEAQGLSKNAFAGVAGLGYGFGNGVRVELDGNWYRNTDAKADNIHTPIGILSFRTRGGENTFGAMMNVLYDIPLGFQVTPYAGGGIGYEKFVLNSPKKSGDENNVGSHGSFAYDLVAGLSYPVSFVPGLSLTAEYRFSMLTARRGYAEFVTAGPSGGTNTYKQQSSNSFFLGLRYKIF